MNIRMLRMPNPLCQAHLQACLQAQLDHEGWSKRPRFGQLNLGPSEPEQRCNFDSEATAACGLSNFAVER